VTRSTLTTSAARSFNARSRVRAKLNHPPVNIDEFSEIAQSAPLPRGEPRQDRNPTSTLAVMSEADTSRSPTPRAQGVEPNEGDRSAVLALVRSHGEAKAAALLRVDRATLARVAAQFSVREGTLALVRQRLASSPVVQTA
jgi:hypothetical protein